MINQPKYSKALQENLKKERRNDFEETKGSWKPDSFYDKVAW